MSVYFVTAAFLEAGGIFAVPSRLLNNLCRQANEVRIFHPLCLAGNFVNIGMPYMLSDLGCSAVDPNFEGIIILRTDNLDAFKDNEIGCVGPRPVSVGARIVPRRCEPWMLDGASRRAGR